MIAAESGMSRIANDGELEMDPLVSGFARLRTTTIAMNVASMQAPIPSMTMNFPWPGHATFGSWLPKGMVTVRWLAPSPRALHVPAAPTCPAAL